MSFRDLRLKVKGERGKGSWFMRSGFIVQEFKVQGFMGSSLPYKIRKTMNDLSAVAD